ncbi:MAG: M23 family metallopeptidase [Xanthomonadaceae bacterium]|nr:M23 family metallopeptidase [Xanthomonadaceae bacterium]
MSRTSSLVLPLARWTLVMLAIALAGYWTWRQPWMQASAEAWRLARLPAPTALPVPVEGVRARHIADTWGGARSGGRKHQGVDIFAKRGTPVHSATHGVVIGVKDYGLGGKQVWVIGPGGERHYYAHLDDFAPGIARFDRVQPGTLLGHVGDTGNARGTPPHLHYGIYAMSGAYNPWPLLQAGDRTGSAVRPVRR